MLAERQQGLGVRRLQRWPNLKPFVNGDQPNCTEYACPGGGSAPRYILDDSAAGVDLHPGRLGGSAGTINLRWRPDDPGPGFRSMSVASDSLMTETETEPQIESESESPEPPVEPTPQVDPAPPVAPEPEPDPVSTEPPGALTQAAPPAESPPD